MIRYRRSFGRWITSIAGDFGPANIVAAGGGGYAYRANIGWAIGLILAIILSITSFIFLQGLTLQIALAVLWGVFIGLTLLFYLPQKLLITIIGGVLGSGLTNLSDLVEKIKNFAGSAKDINEILNGLFGGQILIQNGTVFVFMVLVLLCCVPAYRGQGD